MREEAYEYHEYEIEDLENRIEELKLKIKDLETRIEELEEEVKLEKLRLELILGEKILEDLVVEAGSEDDLYLLSYLIFDEKRLELRILERRLEEKSCLITEERMNQLRFEDEVLEDLEERFNSRSELVFDQERMNQLQNIVGVCGGNGYKKEDLEGLEELLIGNKKILLEKIENYEKELEDYEEFKERIEAIRLDDDIKLVLDVRLKIKRLKTRLYKTSM
ncbi:chromosome partition protein Smc-like [Hydra vulgaris]|uniref:chromosome partition protein Smc-like n=1 Tax=Hydra vulgaris TaxID=6087 RepID=UPI0032EA5E77